MSHWIDPFLTALQSTGNVSQSARAAGIGTQTAYALKRTDADFAAAWDNALEDATDALENEARRRALEGVNEPVVYQGQLTPLYEYDSEGRVVIEAYDTGTKDKDGKPVTGSRPKQLVKDGAPQWLTVNKRSDPVLMFLLKGLRKKYGTESHEITGKDGAPLSTVDETQRAARVAALLEIAKTRKAGVEDLL